MVAVVVNCEVLGRFVSSIPLVPPPLASCCLVAALLERLEVLDDDVDATAILLLATALVEVDDETQDPVVEDDVVTPLPRELRRSRFCGGCGC